MGLSGRKVKQRIGADPRNLTWADDASKFGQSYLAKFGWDSSQGLGATGDGRTTHIKVSQKLDMLGIGAAHQADPSGLAWKQNKDFENLLKRLNSDSPAEDAPVATALDGFVQSTQERPPKKRKHEDKESSSQKKKRKKTPEVAEEPAPPQPALAPRRRAYRAKAMAAKGMASKSAAAMAEILGISAPSPSTAPESPTPMVDEPPLEKLTTSTKSVSDYFKEKLLAKAVKLQPSVEAEDDEVESRGGLGSWSSPALMLPARPPSVADVVEDADLEEKRRADKKRRKAERKERKRLQAESA